MTIDWTEVLSYLIALDSIHGSTSWLDLSSAGTKHATCWRVTVVSVFPVAAGDGAARKVVSQVTWPNVDSKDFVSAVYGLVMGHDYRISKEVYKQNTFTGP
jgi:hypothetical protein